MTFKYESEKFWKQHNPKQIVEDCLIDVKRDMVALNKQTSANNEDNDQNSNIVIIDLKPSNGVYCLDIDSKVLEKYPKVLFKNEDKLIAKVHFVKNNCNLVCYENYTLDLRLFIDCENLNIKTCGDLIVSGHVNATANIGFDGKNIFIKEWASPLNNGCISTQLKAKNIRLCSLNTFQIDDRVYIQSENILYLVAKNINNSGFLRSKELAVVAFAFTNSNEISSNNFSCYVSKYMNRASGEVKISHNLSVYADDYLDKGELRANLVNLIVKSANIDSYIVVHGKTIILAKNEVYFANNAILKIGASFVVNCEGNIQYSSSMICNDAIVLENNQFFEVGMFAGKKLSTFGKMIFGKAKVVLSADKSLLLNGVITSKNQEQSQLMLINKGVKSFIKSSIDNFAHVVLNMVETCSISGNISANKKLSISSGEFDLSGNIISDNSIHICSKKNVVINKLANLFAKGNSSIICDSLYNKGNILCKKHLYFGINIFTCNIGNIVANSFKSDTGCFLNIWYINIDKSFNVNALLSLSGGIIRAGGYRNNTLAMINCGIYLPNIAYPTEIFNIDNLVFMGKQITNFISPSLFSILNTSLMLWQNMISFSNLYNQINSVISDIYNGGIYNIPMYRIIPMLVTCKDTAFLTLHNSGQLKDISKKMHKMYKDINIKEYDSYKNVEQKLTSQIKLTFDVRKDQLEQILSSVKNITDYAKSIVAKCSSNYSTDSLIDFHLGGVISPNIFSKSLFIQQLGIKAALCDLTSKSIKLINNGICLSFGNIAISGSRFINTNQIFSYGNVSASFQQITLGNNSQQKYLRWFIESDKLQINGSHIFQQSKLITEFIDCESRSRITFNDSAIDIEKQITVKHQNHFFLENNSFLKAKYIVVYGQMDLNNVLVDEVTNFSCEENSILKVNDSIVKAHASMLSGKVYMNNFSRMLVKDKIKIKSIAFVKLTHSSILDSGIVDISGEITLGSGSIINAKKQYVQNKSGKLVAKNKSVVYGKELVEICGRVSLDNKSKMIGFSRVLQDKSSVIKCDNESKILGDDIELKGKFVLDDKSIICAKNKIESFNDADVIVKNESVIGHIVIDEKHLITQNISLAGKVELDQKSSIRAKEKIEIKKDAVVFVKNGSEIGVFKFKEIYDPVSKVLIYGKIDLTNKSTIEARNLILIDKCAKVGINDESSIVCKMMEVNGKVKLNNKSKLISLFSDSAIDISKNINVNKEGELEVVNNSVIVGDVISVSGKVALNSKSIIDAKKKLILKDVGYLFANHKSVIGTNEILEICGVVSLDNKSKMIGFSRILQENRSVIKCDNESKILGDDIELKGKFVLDDKSIICAKNKIESFNDADVIVKNESVIGHIVIDEKHLITQNISLAGKVELDQKSSIRAKEKIEIKKDAVVFVKNGSEIGVFKFKEIYDPVSKVLIYGKIDLTNKSVIEARNLILIDKSSQTDLNDESGIVCKMIEVNGSVKLNNKSKFISLFSDLTIDTSKNINVDKEGELEVVNNSVVIGDVISISGKVTLNGGSIVDAKKKFAQTKSGHLMASNKSVVYGKELVEICGVVSLDNKSKIIGFSRILQDKRSVINCDHKSKILGDDIEIKGKFVLAGKSIMCAKNKIESFKDANIYVINESVLGHIVIDEKHLITKNIFLGGEVKLDQKSSIKAKEKIEIKNDAVVFVKNGSEIGVFKFKEIYDPVKKVLIYGKIDLTNKSTIEARSLILIDKCAKAGINDESSIVCKMIEVNGKVDLKNMSELFSFAQLSVKKNALIKADKKSTIIGKICKCNGEMYIVAGSMANFIDSLEISDKSKVNIEQSSLSSSNVDIYGRLLLHKSLLKAKNNINVKKEGMIETCDANIITNNLNIEGKIDGNKLLKLKIKNTLWTAINGSIASDVITGDVYTLHNQGSILSRKHMFISALLLLNRGDIKSSGSMQHNIDGSCINTGNLIANKYTCNAAAILNMAYIYGYDLCNINALLYGNLWVLRSYNMNINAILLGNLGLHFLSMPSDINKSIFSYRTLINSVKCLSYSVLPVVANVINILSGVANIVPMTEQVLKEAKNIYNQGIYNIKLSELISLSVGLLNVTDTIVNTAGECTEVANIVQKYMKSEDNAVVENDELVCSEDPEKEENKEELEVKVSVSNAAPCPNHKDNSTYMLDSVKNTLSDFGVRLFESSLPSISTNSIWNISNVESSGSIKHRNYFHDNGSSISYNYNLDSKYANNYGVFRAYKVKLRTDDYTNFGVFYVTGSLDAKSNNLTNKDAVFKADNARLELKRLNVINNGVSEEFKSVSTIQENFLLRNSEVIVKGDAYFDKSCMANFANVRFKVHDIKMDGIAKIDGIVSIDADKKITFDETSIIHGNKGKLFLKSKEGDIKGEITTEKVSVEIDHINVNELISGNGKYERINPIDTLLVKSKKDERIDKEIDRKCGVALVAESITIDDKLKSEKHIILDSEKGSLFVNANINANEMMQLKSGNEFVVNGSAVQAKSDLEIVSKKGMQNVNGIVSGDKVIVEGASIKNIQSNERKLAKISGNIVSLQATEKNIENYGGTIEGKKYLVCEAKGYILNVCNESVRKGRYDTIIEYYPAKFIGGEGLKDPENGFSGKVGMLLKSGEKIINDGSIFESKGVNVFYCNKGYEEKARSNTYVAKKYEKSRFLGFRKKEGMQTETSIQRPNLISKNGRNEIYAKNGEIIGLSSSFISKDGTTLRAKDNVRLIGLKVKNEKCDKSSWLWGVISSHQHVTSENVIPVVIYDSGKSSIISKCGDIEGIDVVISGDGELETSAKNISFSGSKLKYTVLDESKKFGLSCFGSKAVKLYFFGGNPISALVDEDVTLTKGCELVFNSNNIYEGLANFANFSLSAYGAVKTTISSLKQQQLGASLLQRYSLGDNEGFNPTIHVNYLQAKNTYDFEMPGLACIKRKNWRCEVENSLSLNGVEVKLEQDSHIKAKEFKLNGVVLNSDFSTNEKTLSLGLRLNGEFVNFGGGFRNCASQSRSYVNALFKVDGRLHIEVEKCTITSANIEAKAISGEIKKLSVTSKQDRSEQNGYEFFVSTSGDVHYSQTSYCSRKTQKLSGIVVGDKQNSIEKHNLRIEKAKITGGEIINKSKNNIIEIDKLEAKSVFGESYGNVNGITGNMFALSQSFHNESSNNIHTASVNYGKTSKKVKIIPTVYALFNNIKIRDHIGEVNTTGISREKTIVEHGFNIKLDVPLISPLSKRRKVSKHTRIKKYDLVKQQEKQSQKQSETGEVRVQHSEVKEKNPQNIPKQPILDHDYGAILMNSGSLNLDDDICTTDMLLTANVLSDFSEHEHEYENNEYISSGNKIRIFRALLKTAKNYGSCCDKHANMVLKALSHRDILKNLDGLTVAKIIGSNAARIADKSLGTFLKWKGIVDSTLRRSSTYKNNNSIECYSDAFVVSFLEKAAKTYVSTRLTKSLCGYLAKRAGCTITGLPLIAVWLGTSCIVNRSFKPIEEFVDGMFPVEKISPELSQLAWSSNTTPHEVSSIMYAYAWHLDKDSRRAFSDDCYKEAKNQQKVQVKNAMIAENYTAQQLVDYLGDCKNIDEIKEIAFRVEKELELEKIFYEEFSDDNNECYDKEHSSYNTNTVFFTIPSSLSKIEKELAFLNKDKKLYRQTSNRFN